MLEYKGGKLMPEVDRIKRVWCTIEGKEFEAYFTGKDNIYTIDIPAEDVFSKDRADDIYRLFLHARDWATNEASMDSYDETYGRFLEIEITEAIAYDPLDEDPVIPPMIAWLLDKTYMPIRVIDGFESFIWTDRFNSYGDFELYLPMDTDIFNDLKIGYYIGIQESDRLMVIEKIKLSTNAESGHHITVSGRSLESILDRRVVWNSPKPKVDPNEPEDEKKEQWTGQVKLKGNFQEKLKELITSQFIKPDIKNRAIPLFGFLDTTDERITKLKINRMYLGDSMYDVIQNLCYYKDIGFKILPKGRGGFQFSFYEGADRTYAQTENPWVIFSPWYENLSSSENLQNYEGYKNVGLIQYEYDNPLPKYDSEGNEIEEEPEPMFQEVISKQEESSGLDRRELYIDGGIPAQEEIKLEDGEELDKEKVEAAKKEYDSQVKNAGLTQIRLLQDTDVFSGEIDPVRQFTYGTDFFIGDIVQIENEYGMKKVMRVGEIIRSHDSSGIKISPSFVELHPPEDDEDDFEEEGKK